jgi:hypothetical protein
MSALSFSEFLTEGSPAGKLTHLQHLEDLLLDDGVPGMEFILTLFKEFHHLLKHGGVTRSMHLTTKWDGAPSIVFGPDPADGQFFVATKAAFSKTPKLLKTHNQIHDTYGDGDLANVLHACLSELALLHPKSVLQGDLLFTAARPVEPRTIDGVTHLTFRPNTILYAVDASSSLGQRIERAQLGIVIHTMYKGSGRNFATYSAAPLSPSVFSTLSKTSRVVTIDNRFDDVSGSATFTSTEESDFLLALERVRTLYAAVSPALIAQLSGPDLRPIIQQFLNTDVRGGGFGQPDKLFTRLMTFLASKRDTESAKRSSETGKTNITQQFNTLMTLLREKHRSILSWFELHTAINQAKLMIIAKLNQVSSIGTFIETPNGLQVTAPEGFVAVSHSGKMIKLVDRLTFSRNNFLLPKQWQS